MLTTQFFADPAFVGLLRFWHTSRGDRALPDWSSDVDALPGELLPHLAVVDLHGEPTYRYIGAEVARLWGGRPVGRPVFTVVLRGTHRRYLKSLSEEVIARRAPIFSSAVYQSSDDGVVLTGRVVAPFTDEGATEPLFLLAVQLFKGSEQDLRAIDVAGIVHELRRDLITDVVELCARLEEARRRYQIARHTRQRMFAQDVELITQELAGSALIPLPCFDEPDTVPDG